MATLRFLLGLNFILLNSLEKEKNLLVNKVYLQFFSVIALLFEEIFHIGEFTKNLVAEFIHKCNIFEIFNDDDTLL